MSRRRSNNLQGLTILNRGSWCVVSDMTNRVLAWIEVGSSADWRVHFTEVIQAARSAGWELENEAPAFSSFFCRRNGVRVQVSLQARAPQNPLSEWPMPPPAATIIECLQVTRSDH
jgi:hypothetical protein